MPVDLLLYAALAAGWLLGRVLPHRSPWVARGTLACVAALLVLLGASFRDTPVGQLLLAVPYAVVFVTLLFVATAAVAVLLRPRTPAPTPRPVASRRERVPSSVLLALALLAGVGLGREVALPTSQGITWALYALLAIVGFGLDLTWAPLRRAWVPVTASVAGAVVAAVVMTVATPLGGGPVFATSLAFGWYSLAGPLVATRAGATLGLCAFLVNFLREGLTILLAPRLGPALGGEGLASLGGATAMDTTLFFVVRYGDPEAGSLALASGLVLTAAASVLVPLALAL